VTRFSRSDCRLTFFDSSVNRIVQSTEEKRIEFKTLSSQEKDTSSLGKGSAKERRERIVRRAAKELKDGMYGQ
jgi:3-oxoacid CoA-transferase